MWDGVSFNVPHLLMNDARWELYWFLVLTCNGIFIVAVLWSITIILLLKKKLHYCLRKICLIKMNNWQTSYVMQMSLLVFVWIHWCISCQILSLRVICVFSDIVWQCSVCHMWRCVNPNICSNFHFWKQNIQVICSLFPNWCHVVPWSSIGAMLFLTPLSYFFIYHPIRLKQIAAIIPIISFELSGFLLFWSHTN